MTGIVFRCAGKGVLISGFMLAYVLIGTFPAVAAAKNRPQNMNSTCEHPAPPPSCTWVKGRTCAQDHLVCISPVCEHAAPPPRCTWVTGSTCAQDHLVCAGR